MMISPITPIVTHNGCSTCHFIRASPKSFLNVKGAYFGWFASKTQSRIVQCSLKRVVVGY
jgi:hypothetical protein